MERERQFGQLLAIANVLINKIYGGNGHTIMNKYWEKYQREPAKTFTKIHENIISYIYKLDKNDIVLLDLFQSILADMDYEQFNDKKLNDDYLHTFYKQKDLLQNLIGVDKAAELWGLSEGYIKNLCAEGKIIAIKIGKTWVMDKRHPNPKKRGNYCLEGLEEKKMYMKHVDTGAVKTMVEWTKIAIREFTEIFNNDESLQEEFESLQAYLKWAEQRGQLYADLVECDKDGNKIDYINE